MADWKKPSAQIDPQTGFAILCGWQTEHMEPGRASVTLAIGEEHLNPLGAVHGGLIFSLADTAAALACHYDGAYHPSIDGHLEFIRPVFAGDTIRAEGQELRHGRSLIVCEAAAFRLSDGKLIAKGLFKYHNTPKEGAE